MARDERSRGRPARVGMIGLGLQAYRQLEAPAGERLPRGFTVFDDTGYQDPPTKISIFPKKRTLFQIPNQTEMIAAADTEVSTETGLRERRTSK